MIRRRFRERWASHGTSIPETELKYTKQRYRVRNWPEYEASLRKRGDLTLWFSEEAIAAWQAPTGEKPGGQPVYSDLSIEAALTIRL
ncbi:MAG: transposase, partial [Gammaproteobacteria bacterium]|nr:transposase [Gammaproteobacteria bacterium]